MIRCSCLIQAGQIAEAQQINLEAGLDKIAQTYFSESVEVGWTQIAKGSGFTDSKPSQSSIISMQVPADTVQDTRVDVLHAICDLWTAETGCHVDDVVATAMSA
jgi:hypothetical protein